MQELIKANHELEEIMPRFINHDSARMWFKERLGNHFVMVDSYTTNNVKFYVYHLIRDRLTYLKSMNAIREGSPFVQSDFRNSYEEIEISEHGYVYFIERGKNNVVSEQRSIDRIYSKSHD